MISIIIPIYNAEKELGRMLASIKQQSYTDFEVVMIDDGSKDKSAQICADFAAEDSRFKYYHQQNSGVSVARNNGLKKAKGDFITFVDADDEIDNNYLEVLFDLCRNSDIAVCDTVMENDGIEINRFTGNNMNISSVQAINYLLCRKIINSGPCSKMYRRSIISGSIFPMMKTYEDILFNIDVFLRAESISISSETQYHYIQNDQGAMSGMKKFPSTDIVVATDSIMQFIEKNKNLDPECTYVTISHLFQYILSLIRKECEWNQEFIIESKILFKKYYRNILKCTVIPWKEKVVFLCFIFGWIYENKKWVYINNMR